MYLEHRLSAAQQSFYLIYRAGIGLTAATNMLKSIPGATISLISLTVCDYPCLVFSNKPLWFLIAQLCLTWKRLALLTRIMPSSQGFRKELLFKNGTWAGRSSERILAILHEGNKTERLNDDKFLKVYLSIHLFCVCAAFQFFFVPVGGCMATIPLIQTLFSCSFFS